MKISEDGVAVRVAPCTVMVALPEAVIAGVMPLVVATPTFKVQVPDNPTPIAGLTVKLSGVAVVERVMVDEAGVTVQGPPEAMEAVTVAGRVVGLAGAKESAALLVQVTLAVPAVTGLAGVQVSVVRVMVGTGVTPTVTVAVAILPLWPVAVIVAVAVPPVPPKVGRLAGTMVMVSGIWPRVLEARLSVIHGQGVVDAQVEVKVTLPVVPNWSSVVLKALPV